MAVLRGSNPKISVPGYPGTTGAQASARPKTTIWRHSTSHQVLRPKRTLQVARRCLARVRGGRHGPDGGLGSGVVFGPVAVDRRLETDTRVEAAAAEALSGRARQEFGHNAEAV